MDAKTKMGDAELGEMKVSNTVIREIIGAKLSIQDLKAEFDNGTLTLRGWAADLSAREKALAIASRTAGVRRVEDKLEVAAAGGAAGAAKGGAPGGRSYTVKKGDTLSQIAQRELGAASRWKEIFEANRGTISDADKIFPGQVLTLPTT
jgi:nucleoid-associated protein YgaU